jgi:hypothetical protein
MHAGDRARRSERLRDRGDLRGGVDRDGRGGSVRGLLFLSVDPGADGYRHLFHNVQPSGTVGPSLVIKFPGYYPRAEPINQLLKLCGHVQTHAGF